ncbi:hypothetical protein DICSQDRAFT_111837 [Dichomitus squalens LYAD-421 SS1]|uniref:RRM domain-containing protein n=2 Tax=Dichomitus squalens TaxID=114155 RepID=A0A4Q9M816_9APHY|nr:uncharacterized protein DICSQDRAFT_111837 [Dichomitus squalens LYAD-421 SS1]EJF57379.1 hypothetical protein DICSQDRAFT_111837 [Dichomitus squalens LYAD-421 SS1]TBU23165.1 hypothetical protein BD311DRAFT_731830 [Dichomitus squalens]
MQAYHSRHGMNTYRSPKQQILGNQATKPPPAWRSDARTASGSHSEGGSKILLSRLPADVEENEVEILFSKTVGPVREVLMVYNSQGRSRGMAVVAFARPTDAAVARAKYNGKIVDGRRPIKIEIVTDDDQPRNAAPAPAIAQPSLLARLGPVPPTTANVLQVNGKKANAQPAAVPASRPAAVPAAQPKARTRTKQGARRLKKQRRPKPMTAAELDAQIEEYLANRAPIKVSDSMV